SCTTVFTYTTLFRSPTPQKTYISSNGQNTERLKLVLIGNGLAGMRCLEDLLDMALDRYDITVIGEEPWGNYNRIMLSPVLSGERSEEHTSELQSREN